MDDRNLDVVKIGGWISHKLHKIGSRAQLVTLQCDFLSNPKVNQLSGLIRGVSTEQYLGMNTSHSSR